MAFIGILERKGGYGFEIFYIIYFFMFPLDTKEADFYVSSTQITTL